MKFYCFIISFTAIKLIEAQTPLQKLHKDSIKADFTIDESYSPVYKFTNISKYATVFNWSFYNTNDIVKTHSKFTKDKQNISKSEVVSVDFRDSIGTYWVCLEAENIFGFKDTICKTLVHNDEHIDSPPNVFVPDKSGTSTFNIKGNFDSSQLTIFNRWGEKVFESKDIKTGWNGKKMNVGEYCADGTYYYIFKYKYVHKDSFEPILNGAVNLINN